MSNNAFRLTTAQTVFKSLSALYEQGSSPNSSTSDNEKPSLACTKSRLTPCKWITSQNRRTQKVAFNWNQFLLVNPDEVFTRKMSKKLTHKSEGFLIKLFTHN